MNQQDRYYPEGHYVRSHYWKNYKKSLPMTLPENLTQIALGITLGDATLYKTKTEGTKMKIEQGYKHKLYVEELCLLFKDWTFYKNPYVYVAKTGPRSGEVKSYFFRTFAHPAFDFLWDLFMISGKKTYKPGTITKYLNPLGLCYWIADDGSLHAKSNEIILNTQGFSFEENVSMCKELNDKFKLHGTVKLHKGKYWILYIPAKDAPRLHALLAQLPASIKRKLPKLKKKCVFVKRLSYLFLIFFFISCIKLMT